ncbi:MAG TPA: YlxR family protein [Bacilli bacterium]|mgnify:CR=1 FL=1|nr:YlxR family protein [Bacilli bacterium]
MKKIPLRTCIVTKEKLDKRDLIRIVKDKDGNVSVDLTGRANGKGVYLKKDKEVILKASKYLPKALECEIESEIYEELEKLVK